VSRIGPSTVAFTPMKTSSPITGAPGPMFVPIVTLCMTPHPVADHRVGVDRERALGVDDVEVVAERDLGRDPDLDDVGDHGVDGAVGLAATHRPRGWRRASAQRPKRWVSSATKAGFDSARPCRS
jgi:hypothetical protein